MRRNRRLRIALIALGLPALLALTVDTSGGHWSSGDHSNDSQQAGRILASPISASSVALGEIPAREALRWCCAFGVGMGVSFAGVPLPFLDIGAVLEPDRMRYHHYDGGGMFAEFLSVVDEKLGFSLPNVEQNGLLYTCDAGFVDTSHIRELVDWTAFLFAHFDGSLERGGSVELKYEGATRTVVSKPVPPALIDKLGRDRVILTMAQWTAYQTSIWHETAQWYGFSIWSLFPETASGFSLEDPFANLMGITLLEDSDIREVLRDNDSFNRSVEALMVDAVNAYRPLPRSVTIDALMALDGIWWDSKVRLPEKAIVKRREFDIDGELEAWLLPKRYASKQLQATLEASCGPDPKPARLRVPNSLDGIPMREFVSLEIEIGIDSPFAELPAFAGIGRFDQEYFPEMVEKVRAENLIEFGQGSDRPD